MTEHRFGLMDDLQLQDAVARLEATVAGLQQAEGEIGLRIRATYQTSLDAARLELSRRRVRAAMASMQEADDAP